MPFSLSRSIICVLFVVCLLPGHSQDSSRTVSSSLNSLSTNDDVVGYANDVARKILSGHETDSYLNAHWVDSYVTALGEVEVKTLVATFSQLPLPTDPKQEDARKIMLEHYLLRSAISKYATVDNIPELLETNTFDVLEIISTRHWQDDPRVSAFLIRTLEQYQASPPQNPNFQGDPTRAVLLLANLSHDPKVKATLADSTAKAASDPSASPAYLKILADSAKNVSSSPTSQKSNPQGQTNETLTDDDRTSGIIVGNVAIPKGDQLEVIISGLARPGIKEILQHRKQNYQGSEYIVALASLGYYQSSLSLEDIRRQLGDLEGQRKAKWVHFPEDETGRCTGKWDVAGDQANPDGTTPAAGYYDMYSAIHHAVQGNKTSVLLISLFTGGDKAEATQAIINEMRVAKTRLYIIAADPTHPPYPGLAAYAKDSGGTAIVVNQGYDPYLTPNDSNKQVRQYTLAPETANNSSVSN